ncbi:lipoprotein BA_5634 family protein [Bacillus rhizoplanae]|uniref:lipoprotein BA_5634 family protein n=1 Tax=Bacillus rhizoplanae TaxID=2880966 RepID=UPI003D1D9216
MQNEVNHVSLQMKEQGALFAKEELANVTIDGNKLKYEGNIIIGDGRSYADMFAVVDDATYTKIKGEEKSVGVLRFDKDPAKDLPKQGSA